VEAGEEGDWQRQNDECSCDRQRQLRLADEGDRGLTVVEPVAPGKEPFHLSASLPSSSASSSAARRAAFRSAMDPPLSRDRAAVVFDEPTFEAPSDEASSASVSVGSPVSDSSVSVSADSACEASSLWLRLRSAIEPPACLRFFFPLDVADEAVDSAAVDSAAVVDSAWESSEDSPALRRRAFSRRLASGDFALSGPLMFSAPLYAAGLTPSRRGSIPDIGWPWPKNFVRERTSSIGWVKRKTTITSTITARPKVNAKPRTEPTARM